MALASLGYELSGSQAPQGGQGGLQPFACIMAEPVGLVSSTEQPLRPYGYLNLNINSLKAMTLKIQFLIALVSFKVFSSPVCPTATELSPR